ncbi:MULTISPECIES: histidine phosphatase family protein [Sphingomonas]|uniref:histidine phosphatase family protein n=1 Tax=Sphingomonas TaxID=13687 RepID=UPI000F7EE41C|nr:histidine phosphatase family protein [Sphingomonas sp. ABOLF]RSV15476.1 histidine phosphatase family protein [Sphingomonas sp. ABOLF]GLK22428.1 phosphoglycerate mutase [Microbacterium terregens]
MSATVLLARHGSHDEVGAILSGRSEIALNAAGRAEAERLAERLTGTALTAIHSSPRRRTRETAEIVAARHGLEVVLVDALDEVDFGAWTGCSFDSLHGDPEWDRWNAERATASTPGGETMAAATTRAVAHIASLEGAGGPVMCVSHCDVIRGAAAHFLGLSLDRLLAFDCAPGSLTTLALAGGQGRIVTLNEVPQ